MPHEAGFPNIEHFEELQRKINNKLEIIKDDLYDDERRIVEDQINTFKWLYGALGQLPSIEMFIAENPSLAGIEHDHVGNVDDQSLDIEAQWRGGINDKGVKVFRPVLFDLGLKTSPPNQKGGWNCYITNVIKRANYAKYQENISAEYRKEQENYWSEILRWEIENVKPSVLYCLGKRTEKAAKRLIKEGRIQNIPSYYVYHYSARGNLNNIRETMKTQILNARADLNL